MNELAIIGRIAFVGGAIGICLLIVRLASRAWLPLGIVVAAGLLSRASIGLLLFAISYYQLPILQSLQLGGGFWRLAPDATVYYQLGVAAASGNGVPGAVPSPTFVAALGWWMWATGQSAVTAVLFNLTLYAAACGLLVVAFRPFADSAQRHAALLAIAAFSFSPALVLHGTQPLKDMFFASLAVAGIVALAMFLLGDPQHLWRTTLVTALVSFSAIYLIAGVRAYYAVLMCGAAALGAAVRTVALPIRQMAGFTTAAACVLLMLWCGFMFGSHDYYVYYGGILSRTIGVPLPFTGSGRPGAPGSSGVTFAPVIEVMDVAREGFAASGGGTNIAISKDWRPPFAKIATGMAVVFVPVSLLSTLSVVNIAGRRGFIAIADVDTLFILAVLIGTGRMLYVYRDRVRQNLAVVCFCGALGLVSAVLLGYIVTNYGTLFRLRPLATIPLSLLLLAVKRSSSGDTSRAPSSQAGQAS